MMLDKNTLFSDDQDLAKTAAAYLSTYSYDTGADVADVMGNTPISDIGRGTPIEVLCQVTETFVGATATLIVELIMADDAALGTNPVSLQQAPGGSYTVGIPVATLVAGYQFRIGGVIPPGVSKRYLGLKYTILTATTTAGKITAGLVSDKQTNNAI